jgi:hypothetical protein
MSVPITNTAFLSKAQSQRLANLSDRVTKRLSTSPRKRWGRIVSLYFKATPTNYHGIIIAAYESLLPPEDDDE